MTKTTTPPKLPRSSTTTLIVATSVLANDIQSDDGAANASIREASNRLSEMHLMLMHAYPLVKSQHGAEHMLDGFRPKKRPIDALAKKFDDYFAQESAV